MLAFELIISGGEEGLDCFDAHFQTLLATRGVIVGAGNDDMEGFVQVGNASLVAENVFKDLVLKESTLVEKRS